MAVLKKTATGRVKRAADPTIQTYRALFPLNVAGEDGVVRTRQFGDYVPEVATWPKPGIWLQTRRIEVVHINQSELDRWQEDWDRRCAEEDERRLEQEENDREIERVRRELEELEARKAGKSQKSVPQPPQDFQPEPAVEQKIDFGSVRMAKGGAPRPVEMPAMTRAPQIPQSVSENRVRPVQVRRVVRKKG